MAIFAIPAMAATDYPMITFEDSADFTVIKGYLQTEVMTVQGLDSSYVKHDLGADEQYVTWTSSNTNVVRFRDGIIPKTSITGKDTVTVQTLIPGTAVVTATYDTPTADPVTVTSYVVVEGTTTTSSVSGIDIDVDGYNTSDFSFAGLTVPLFDLSDAGITDNDNDVLKKTPTALHAFLYALEIQNSTETTSTPIGSFDWDWVKDNVVLNSEGSYLQAVGTDDGGTDWTRGWQFTVNDDAPEHAASVAPLTTNAEVTWGFLPW
ncbi:hypothetical protein GC105_16265 [Alkalibaculum sp. M08DMB]|uniref:DUF4430 domain-containing protein n=2 Tax=Alkalibaculum sporogenes TaxID=2655001 RepID=A0A6A7KDA5_9FIRM|nr:hypothetical protein [Alkalibaculum sporogenes]